MQLVVSPALVLRLTDVDSHEGVIRALAAQMHAAGVVRDSYAEAVLARERIYPTGLPTPEPVALPHTDVAHCVQPAVGLALLAQPVTFRMMGDPNQMVNTRTVLALSVVDPKAQVQVLTRLIDFCQKTENILSLHVSSDPADVLTQALNASSEVAPPTEAGALPEAVSAIRLTITHAVGLHARPAAKFVQTAAKFKSDITVTNLTAGSATVNAKSILKVLTLAVKQNHQIEVRATGEDAADALAALQALVDSNFGE
jgi:phosphotransferase system HPr (HPr) family protein